MILFYGIKLITTTKIAMDNKLVDTNSQSLEIQSAPALSSLHEKINQGVKVAIKQALEKHEKLDQAISVYQDGKIITLKGKQISDALKNKKKP